MKMNRFSSAGAACMAAAILLVAATPILGQAVKIGRCDVQSVDCTNMTITVQTTANKETFTLYVTSRTHLFRNGEPAITADYQPGDIGHGSAYTNADDKVEAVRFYAKEAKPGQRP